MQGQQCKGLCKKLALDATTSWTELCPLCGAYIVFRDGACICCRTSWENFKLKGIEPESKSKQILILDSGVDEQCEAIQRRAIMKILVALKEKSLTTLQLTVKAFNSGNGCKYIFDAEDLGLVNRYKISKGRSKRYVVNVLTKQGEEAVQMYRVFKILNPHFQWDSYKRYKAKKHRMLLGKLRASRGESYYGDEEDYYSDQYQRRDYSEADMQWQDSISLPEVRYHFTEERAVALLEM